MNSAREKPDGISDQFPALTYVPGQVPHPHRQELDERSDESLPQPGSDLRRNLLFGLELFEQGFYWEAHEAWESVWVELGRSGAEANVIKGLIKLAACGVKCLCANRNGATRHIVRGVAIFAGSACEFVLVGGVQIDVRKLQEFAETIQHSLPVNTSPADGQPRSLPNFQVRESFSP